MYTIGFGDQVPATFCGRFVGVCCAILGVLDMAFSLPIIVFEFNYLYNLDRDEEGFHFDARGLFDSIATLEYSILSIKMRNLQKCKLRPEELMGERTEEKMNRINRFHKSLTTSLRKNKGNVLTLLRQGSFII